MEETISNAPYLANIILLTAYLYADQLANMIFQYNSQIEVFVFEHPSQILSLSPIILMRSRLISFGSKFYVGSKILNKLGFGAYNFHPGPPNYAGWAPFNFALYDGAERYGVTVHEMIPEVDAGIIVGQKSFHVRENISLQSLMDETTQNMYILFNELAPDLVRSRSLKPLPSAKWGGKVNTKKMFASMCQLNLDMPREEFDRRMKAFGDGDGEQLPFIVDGGKIYEIASGKELPEHKSLWLHGYRFVLNKQNAHTINSN